MKRIRQLAGGAVAASISSTPVWQPAYGDAKYVDYPDVQCPFAQRAPGPARCLRPERQAAGRRPEVGLLRRGEKSITR
jgi:hypothetical protein